MDIENLQVFVSAISTGSLAGAARRLKLTPMAVTRRIAALEGDLGVRLIHRSTRSIALTPEGEALMPFAVEILEAEEAARAAVSPLIGSATGLLRVSAPVTLGRKVIAPLLPALLNKNPGLSIDLGLNDEVVDIISSGIDVAIRIGPMKDSGLIARPLVDNPKHLYAAPSYLSLRGVPTCLQDLENHECLTFTNTVHWVFQVGEIEQAVKINSRFTSSGVDGFLSACIAGLGLARLSAWDVRDEVRSGALVRVDLRDAQPQSMSIWAVYPTRRHVLPKLQVFVSTLQADLQSWYDSDGQPNMQVREK